MTGGEFSPTTRAAIQASTLGRCAGCGATSGLEAHHRAPRGMGGTKRPATAQPFNGLPLCCACHRWTESYRADAIALGWLLPEPNQRVPFWTRTRGWVAWTLLDEGPPCWATITLDDLDEPKETPC